MKAKLVALVLMVFSACSFGAEDRRTGLIRDIAQAQGLLQAFEGQLAEQRKGAQDFGRQVFEKMLSESGGKTNPEAQKAFDRFVDGCYHMFAADEYLATWVSLYGKSLSEEDLEQILQYYKSSIGQKDVAASQVATQAFTAWAVQQSRERSSALLSQLMSELRAAKR